MLRYAASLILITFGLLLFLFSKTYYFSFIPYIILALIYFFAIIEGILLLFPSKHLFIGILLLIESVLAFISCNYPLPIFLLNNQIIVFLPLAVGGVLTIIYKPVVAESVNHPKNARRLLSLGAYLILFAMLIGIIESSMAVGSLEGFGNLTNIILVHGHVFISWIGMTVYKIIAILLFLFAMFVSFRLKTKDRVKIKTYSKLAFLVGISSIIIILATSYFLINAFSFLNNYWLNYSNILAHLSVGPLAAYSLNFYSISPSILGFLNLTYYALIIIGLVSEFLGALMGLAYPKDLRLMRRSSSFGKR